MALADYQKITRVTSGKPFGNGSDGAYSSATIPTMVKVSMSTKASGNTAITVSASTLTNGDILLIHQSRGSGAGQWEINKVASGGGTTSIVLEEALNYTYTDSGSSQAQITVIKQYTDVTVQSGTWTLPLWNLNVGGILTFACNGTLTVTGTITGTGKGYRGGKNNDADPKDNQANQGEGTGGAGSATTAANGNAGGGGLNQGTNGVDYGGGGGGGNATTGTAGICPGAGAGGAGGTTSGVAALTTMTFGGGGGSRSNWQVHAISGGYGGGIIAMFVKDVSSVAGIATNGVLGTLGGDGGGAGGSILIACETATLGTTKITSTGVDPSAHGGISSVGRIAVHHSGEVTGTTSPTFSDTEDSSLVETTASSGATGSFHFM